MTTMDINNSEQLRTVFNLALRKLQEISIDDKVNREISERKKRVFDKNKTNSYFYETLVRDIFGAAFSARTLTDKWTYFREAFSDFNIDRVSEKSPQDLMKYPNIVRRRPKLEACISHAKEFKRISSSHISFGEYLAESEGNEKQLIEKMIKFKFVKDSVARDYLKDIGILDTIKPDSNVCRVFFRLGLINSQNSSDEAIKVAMAFKQSTSEKLIVIDAVFWMYGGGGDGHVEKAMCNSNNPHCNECPLTVYCEYYKRR